MARSMTTTQKSIDWDAATAEATDILSHYVRIDSSHPLGHTDETAALFADHLAAEGISYRIYESPEEGKVNLVARLSARNPRGKPLLLSNHMDTVQAIAEQWRFPPFSGEVADGYIYGRGTLDDKGMGVMELMTMLLLRRTGIELTRDVVLLCTCDEEIGSPMGAQWLVEHHFADLDPAFVLDEGGSGRTGYFSVGDAFEISVAEKQLLRIRMIARAEPGHASQPWPESATHRLVRAAHAVITQPPEDRDCPPVAEMIRRLGQAARGEIAAQRASAPLLHDTVSLTMLEGGYKINVIPERAEMSFDCRLLPDTDPQAFVSNLEQLVNDAGVTFELSWPEPSPPTAPWDNELFRALEAACRKNAPHALVTPSLCVGGTDARFFRQRGVPAYGLVPCIFNAEDLKGYHGLNERLSVANLKLGMQIVYDTTIGVATELH
jgi:acetylornithine deacetylase/succinyl-diaminopimelate desuccinylase-like protein